MSPRLQRILAWAQRQDDIGAVLLTGSRTRPDAALDAASDHDVELYVTTPTRYGGESAWLSEIGPTWVVLPLERADGGVTRLVVFAGGEKVDFQIIPVAELERLATEGLDDLHRRGYRMLLDRNGLAARLPPPPYSPPVRPRPSEEEFLAVCTEFWFEAAQIPGYAPRGELWVVKFRDWTMKEQLLRMIEWHALATRGEAHDVWHIRHEDAGVGGAGRLGAAGGGVRPLRRRGQRARAPRDREPVRRALARGRRRQWLRAPSDMESAIRGFIAQRFPLR